MKKIGEISKVKCKVGLWFLSTVLPLINIYVSTKFNFNPLCTWPRQASTTSMKKQWLIGDKYTG